MRCAAWRKGASLVQTQDADPSSDLLARGSNPQKGTLSQPIIRPN